MVMESVWAVCEQPVFHLKILTRTEPPLYSQWELGLETPAGSLASKGMVVVAVVLGIYIQFERRREREVGFGCNQSRGRGGVAAFCSRVLRT